MLGSFGFFHHRSWDLASGSYRLLFSKQNTISVTTFENKSSRAYFEVWRLHPWHQAINKSTQVFTIYRIVWLAQEFNDILSHWQLLFGVCGGKMNSKIIHDDLTIFFYLIFSLYFLFWQETHLFSSCSTPCQHSI